MTDWSSFSAEIIPTLSAQPRMLLKPRKENFMDNMSSSKRKKYVQRTAAAMCL